jgi:hypothetical protein
MLRRTAAGAVSALLLVGCGSARDTQQATQEVVAVGTEPSSTDASDQSEPRGCPRENWPGPWAECAEADWVREVVRRAGYTAGSDTGSALVASTDDTGFYIWTTAGSAERVSQSGHGVRLGTVAGTPVYGDARVWQYWSAQGFVFWVFTGPSAADVQLSMSALEPLIEASKEVAPPTR